MANHDYIASCGCNGCTIGRLTRELGDARQSIIEAAQRECVERREELTRAED